MTGGTGSTRACLGAEEMGERVLPMIIIVVIVIACSIPSFRSRHPQRGETLQNGPHPKGFLINHYNPLGSDLHTPLPQNGVRSRPALAMTRNGKTPPRSPFIPVDVIWRGRNR